MPASRHRLVERAGVALHDLTVGVSMHPEPEVRFSATLDKFAPKYLSRHTADGDRGGCAGAGLVDMTDLSVGQVFDHAGQGQGVNLAGRRA